MSAVGGWTPEFEGQRPPFQPGHTLSTRHGGYSPRRVDPLANEIRSAVLADPSTDYLQAPRYAAAVWGWARAEAQVQLLTEYLERAGEVSGDGVGDLEQDRVRSAYLLLHRAEARALSGRRALGLDPLAAARLGRDRAATEVDVARVMAEMDRRERELRERDAQLVDGQVVDDVEDEA